MTKVVTIQDEKRTKMIRQQIKENGGYCPCRLVHNDDTKCICKEFRAAIEAGRIGKCHCGLYEIIETDA